MSVRATTPKHLFELGIDVSNLEKVLITYKQGCEKMLEKTLEDCDVDGDKISYRLTQEEMNEFHGCNGLITIQVRILTKEGTAMASEEIYADLYDVLNDEVL